MSPGRTDRVLQTQDAVAGLERGAMLGPETSTRSKGRHTRQADQARTAPARTPASTAPAPTPVPVRAGRTNAPERLPGRLAERS